MNKYELEKYIIKDAFYESIKEELTCSICQSIKVKPVMCTQCQNSFCSSCLDNWNKKSTECPYKCNNPQYTKCIIINNLLSKLNFKCKNDCGKNIPYDMLENHYESECKKIDFKQKYKELTIKYKEILVNYSKFKNNFMSILNFNLDSNIIDDPDDLIFLKNTLNSNINKTLSFQLLYRASRDGDSPLNFHSRCDNKEGGTLILFKTDKNIVFGGFTDAIWISFSNPDKKASGKNFIGTINFLFQLNNKKVYYLRDYENPLNVSSIYCRADCGPCFGFCGEDIWCHNSFLTQRGILHKDKENGRECSFNTTIDYELNNGETDFKLKEIEAFLLV